MAVQDRLAVAALGDAQRCLAVLVGWALPVAAAAPAPARLQGGPDPLDRGHGLALRADGGAVAAAAALTRHRDRGDQVEVGQQPPGPALGQVHHHGVGLVG
jgi:hypothetical protein